jgi:hypothetical protein
VFQALSDHKQQFASLQLWLALAATFLVAGQAEDARFCAKQARSSAPWSADLHFTEGQISEVGGAEGPFDLDRSARWGVLKGHLT